MEESAVHSSITGVNCYCNRDPRVSMRKRDSMQQACFVSRATRDYCD